MSSMLVDTSFLITLADKTRPNHLVAKQYFQECLLRRIPLYLSAIVVSEFQVKQAINDLPLRNFVTLPFNFDHGMKAGLMMRTFERDGNDDRGAVKDDIKLIAQAVCESATHILTEDGNTLAKYLERLRLAGHCDVRAILLSKGFDAAWFNNGQAAIPL